MTIDEAIRIIKIVLVVAEEFEITVQGEEFTKEKCKEAVEIVTKALEQEPCTDAISREAVLEIIEREEFKGDALSEIEKLPPVTPQYTDAEIQKMQDLEFAEVQKAYEIGKEEGSSEKPNRWIPVSEGLPEIHNYMQEYIVTIKGNSIRTAFFTETNGKSWWSIDDVIAWMPLPLPYKASPTGEEVE